MINPIPVSKTTQCFSAWKITFFHLVFPLLTVNPDHVLQDQDPLSQDLQGLPELLQGLALNNTAHFSSSKSLKNKLRRVKKTRL